MTISVRLNEKDTELIKAYAVLEKIEDEYDLECYNKAIREFKENPKTYTLEEIKEDLGL